MTAMADASAPAGAVAIDGITGDNGRLSLNPASNCIGVAARETLALLPGAPACGVRLRLHKGLPLGSGMGSSAASAAAACVAVNKLFGGEVSKEKLVYAGLQSEAAVSGYHADNIAPALLGGFILVRYGHHDGTVTCSSASISDHLWHSSAAEYCTASGKVLFHIPLPHHDMAS